jgi:hypothetical protein
LTKPTIIQDIDDDFVAVRDCDIFVFQDVKLVKEWCGAYKSKISGNS